MIRNGLITICFLAFLAVGCEDTNIRLATEAGMDAVKAVTLTDEEVVQLAALASEHADRKHRLAPESNPYARRLKTLLDGDVLFDGHTFDIRVYLAPTVNAFAMADGTIRIYSGLMDMMDDKELLFVIGHEMGHVTEKHIKNKIRMAYAASAVRKTVASQENLVGDLARSALGGFVESLLNAQFSQAEEREADDCGVRFLKERGLSPRAAVTALQKLTSLGGNHTFLSSHPAPDDRAERLDRQLTSDVTETEPSLTKRVITWLRELLDRFGISV